MSRLVNDPAVLRWCSDKHNLAELADRGAPVIPTALDRMFLFTFFRSYLIVLVSLVSLFVVIDLFTHLDDFTNKPGGFAASVRHITVYYGNRVPELFDLLGNFITLIAGAFTVAWMQRNNELLPLLSAGVPTRRAVRPVLLGSALTLALVPLNQQFLIPEVADQLTAGRDDPDRVKAQVLVGGRGKAGGVKLAASAAALDRVLAKAGCEPIGGTALFRLIRHAEAARLHDELARRHIWCRRFAWRDDVLRFGLPPDQSGLDRLAAAL